MSNNRKQLAPKAGADMTKVPEGMQRIDLPFMTAMRVQVRREMEYVVKECLAEARMMGESFFFAWEVNTRDGKEEIAGMTIDGAMMMLRHWGNAVVMPEVLEATSEYYVVRATFIDLQSGANFARLYKRARTPAPGGFAKSADGRQRWDDMQFSDAQSRAMRNVISSALPKYLIDKCLATARKAAEEGVNPDRERRAIIARAKKHGLVATDLENKLGKRMDDWTAHDFVSMQALLRSIDDGYATPETMFGVSAATSEAPTQEIMARFEKRLREAKSYEDGEIIAGLIKKAVGEGKITQEQRDHLVRVYSEVIAPMKPPEDGDDQPDGGNDG